MMFLGAGAGAAATVATVVLRRPPAVSPALGHVTRMEGLRVRGYTVVDACGAPANQVVTLLSCLHIVFQPLVLDAFAMELVAPEQRRRARPWAPGLAALASLVMLPQLMPLPVAGSCRPGDLLCGVELCTVAGNWHIGWQVPYNGLLVPLDQTLGTTIAFCAYLVAVFALPPA